VLTQEFLAFVRLAALMPVFDIYWIREAMNVIQIIDGFMPNNGDEFIRRSVHERSLERDVRDK
jgi:hypothetical protein